MPQAPRQPQQRQPTGAAALLPAWGVAPEGAQGSLVPWERTGAALRGQVVGRRVAHHAA